MGTGTVTLLGNKKTTPELREEKYVFFKEMLLL